MRKTLMTIAMLGLAGAACAGEKAVANFDALDADKDGMLSPAEFAAAKSQQAFEALDRNSDGKLDPREYTGEKVEPGAEENK